ncbi:MAG: ATPase [Chitinophagaceae bacterium]|nr:MAG: ATPase [Chitinophagaceae bacterium]
MVVLKKVVVIGPESTGKSDLCHALALHFNTHFVPEYAREYLLTNGIAYSQKDLLKIAEGQLELEEKITQTCLREQKPVIFIDTDMQVIKTWSEFVFNSCDTKILELIAARYYDLYLLTNTDLPWQKDELREYPDHETRLKLFHHYRDALVNQAAPWAEVSGTGPERIKIAVEAVDKMFGG